MLSNIGLEGRPQCCTTLYRFLLLWEVGLQGGHRRLYHGGCRRHRRLEGVQRRVIHWLDAFLRGHDAENLIIIIIFIRSQGLRCRLVDPSEGTLLIALFLILRQRVILGRHQVILQNGRHPVHQIRIPAILQLQIGQRLQSLLKFELWACALAARRLHIFSNIIILIKFEFKFEIFVLYLLLICD